MTAEPAAATRYTGIYPGRADQVRHVRHAIARHLAGCPAADDAVLIASELASNAIVVHSRSRTERPHGLDVVQALTGPDGWGVETTTDGGRVIWARLDLEAAGE